MTRISRALIIMTLLTLVGLAMQFTVAVAVQLIPADRPGICGRDCY